MSAALGGVLLGHFLTRNNEYQKWLRTERFTLSLAFLRAAEELYNCAVTDEDNKTKKIDLAGQSSKAKEALSLLATPAVSQKADQLTSATLKMALSKSNDDEDNLDLIMGFDNARADFIRETTFMLTGGWIRKLAKRVARR